tara:strand:+ start:1011 stop:3371 length:2361 start_codon:yes stop_codon:yes gene_type:complete
MDIKKINQLNIIIIFYIILLAGFYIFHSGAPIQYIFNEVFNKNLSFFIQNKPEKVELYIKQFDKNFFYFVPIVPIFLYILIFVYNFKNIILSTPKQFFQTNSDTLHFDLKKININYLIAIAAASGLYLELMMIRVHSSFFQIFAFFKNISLISCLLGLGVGYLLGKKKVYSLKWVLPLLTFQICFLFFIKNTPIGPFLQNPVTEQWAMGQSYASGVIQFSIIYCFLILIFIFNAMAFVPLGHLVSNLMSKQEKLQSYSWNLIGSLSGIILFSLMSWMMTPPILWFFVGFLIIFFLQKKSLIDLSFSVVSLTIVIFLFISTKSVNKENYYSPYQVITVEHYPNSNISIKASNLWFQSPHDFRKNTNWNSYFVPFKVAKKKPDNILVVGSGTGNDVAYALLEKTKSIDAVEIDPLIIKLGEKYHPQKPYNAKNVNVIQNDARNYIQHTNKKYDLIIYGLLDSHTSLSGKGGIRLDSYVYTVDAFKEAKKILNDDGFISLSFSVSIKSLGVKIFRMLEEAFDDQEPIVFFYQENDSFKPGLYTFVVAKDPNKKFILNAENLFRVNFFDDQSIEADNSTDDWPFFYMPKKIWPKSYFVIIMIIFISSFFFIDRTVKIDKKNFSFTCFFLGAGFMLIETKGITELALLYGSNWFVVSIVIAFILIMAFFANLLVIKKYYINVSIVYALILSSLLLGYYVTFLDLTNLPSFLLKILFPTILTVPIFFSGIAFSKQLSQEKFVGIALSSNILGAIFGGLLEYNSMYFGFRSLYLLGFAMYFLAYFFAHKKSYI